MLSARTAGGFVVHEGDLVTAKVLDEEWPGPWSGGPALLWQVVRVNQTDPTQVVLVWPPISPMSEVQVRVEADVSAIDGLWSSDRVEAGE